MRLAAPRPAGLRPHPTLSQRERRGRRSIFSILLALSLFVASPGGASAHANLERSSPNANAVVVEKPQQVFLWFSEEPELRLTELTLLDPTGRKLGDLAPRPAPGDPRAVTANVPDLQPGTFVVRWRTTSAVDGHTTAGAFPFTYGAGQVPTAVTAPGLESTALYVPSIASVIARFLTFTGALGLAGGIAFGPVVLWPALAGMPGRRRSRDAEQSEVMAAGSRALGWLALYAVPALILGTALAALTQAAEASDVSLLSALGDPLQRSLVGTRYGYVFGARMLCALALGATLPLLARAPRSWPVRAVALALSAGLLLTLSLGSHAAAVPVLTPVAIAVDVLHLAAAAVWLGGLVVLCFVLALSPSRSLAAPLVARFSVMAWAVAIVAATGLVQTLIDVWSPSALVETPYGQTLIVKILLVAGMAAIGFYHWRRVGPRLGAQVGGALAALAERFRWTAIAEAALGVLVLGATGLLTAQQPAKDAAVALRHLTVRGTADDLTMSLTVSPGEAGLNRIELDVTSPGALQGVQKVVLRLSHEEMDMGEQEIELQPAREGVYVAQGGQFSMSGRWRAEPLVRRTGRDDARVALTVPIADPLGSNVDQTQPFELTPRMVVGAEAGIFGLILLVASRQLRRRTPRASLPALLIGVAAIGAGGYLTVDAVSAEKSSPARVKNPVTMDQPALARGRQLYQANCFSCHGVAGRGDGPLGRSLNPRPADLRAHVTQHPDGVLFDWIANGVPGTAMPAFKDQIPADDRWRIIGFIKGFAEDGPAPAQTAAAELRRPPPGGPGPAPTATASDGRLLAHPTAAPAGSAAAAAQVDGTTVTARVAPDRYRLGAPNGIAVETTPARDATIRYRVTMVGHEMPGDEGEARALGGGRFELPSAPRFDMGGDWRLDLTVGERQITYWLTVDPNGQIAFQEP